MAFVMRGFRDRLHEIKHLSELLKLFGVGVRSIFIVKVKITYHHSITRQSVRVFKKIRKLFEKHRITQLVPLAWRWTVHTDEVRTLLVKGQRQLRCFETRMVKGEGRGGGDERLE